MTSAGFEPRKWWYVNAARNKETNAAMNGPLKTNLAMSAGATKRGSNFHRVSSAYADRRLEHVDRAEQHRLEQREGRIVGCDLRGDDQPSRMLSQARPGKARLSFAPRQPIHEMGCTLAPARGRDGRILNSAGVIFFRT